MTESRKDSWDFGGCHSIVGSSDSVTGMVKPESG
jgi:hypothetical protein